MAKEIVKSRAKLTEISASDLHEVAIFLHNHMNSKFSPEKWYKGISVNWLDDAPNHGFMLKDESDKIVGVLCAIYSEQYIDGIMEKICNPHSWCVLPEYRKRSVDLVLSVIRQPGYHFTMFSPNKDGIEIFGYLKFKPLDNKISVLLNMPAVSFSGVKILDNSTDAQEGLSAIEGKCYRDHMQFPWLKLLAFSKENRFGFIIYKTQSLKRLPCAYILYVSEPELFQDCWSSIRTHLLLRHGYITSKIEQRLLTRSLKYTLKHEPGGRKFYLSDDLQDEKVKYIYSELMTLDI